MAGYFIYARKEITDEVKSREYSRRAVPQIQHFGGEVLAARGAVEVLEGDWKPESVTVLRFDDMEALKAWYESAEYAPLKPGQQHRRHHRNRRHLSANRASPGGRCLPPPHAAALDVDDCDALVAETGADAIGCVPSALPMQSPSASIAPADPRRRCRHQRRRHRDVARASVRGVRGIDTDAIASAVMAAACRTVIPLRRLEGLQTWPPPARRR
jgi:uncharacterized protein (DUF1330 family)